MTPKIYFDEIPIGAASKVVGALSSARSLGQNGLATTLKLDIAEFRLDLTGFIPGWQNLSRELRAAGIPVLVTIRSRSEGGNWVGSEIAREAAYLEAMPHASAIDIEIQAEISAAVAHAARQAGKAVILSFHDFARTPPIDELRKTIDEGFARGADIVKLATHTSTRSDVETLATLLRERGSRLLSCVGMGAFGGASRVELALSGSCLTYGYADETNAPGQISSAELLQRLKPAGST